MNQFAALVARQMTDDARALPARLRRRLSAAGRAERCGNVAELRALARRSVPRAVFDFVDGAAEDELTLYRNRAGFGHVELWPRVLVDVSAVDTSTTVLGLPVDQPLIGAPTGLTGLTHWRGEAAIAGAVHGAGSVYTLSAMGSYSIEEIARLTSGPNWFQIYMWRDRGLVRDLVERAAGHGYLALMLTVDVPTAGARERDRRNGFGIPPRVTLRALAEGAARPRWASRFISHPRMAVANAAGHGGGPGDPVSLTQYIDSQFDPGLDWDDVAWLRELWTGPLIVKGILRAEDAVRAVRAGADAVVVSNHGGRQLAQAPAAISALAAVVDAVGGEAEVYMDGGVRRGADAVAALALGARACLIGRPLVYGLAVAGDAGAARAMEILTSELRRTLVLLGCGAIRDLDRTWIGAGAAPEAIA